MRGFIHGFDKGSPVFFVEGEDGNTYFSHMKFLVNADANHFIYNGNNVDFEVKDSGKKHMEAIHVVPDNIM